MTNGLLGAALGISKCLILNKNKRPRFNCILYIWILSNCSTNNIVRKTTKLIVQRTVVIVTGTYIGRRPSSPSSSIRVVRHAAILVVAMTITIVPKEVTHPGFGKPGYIHLACASGCATWRSLCGRLSCRCSSSCSCRSGCGRSSRSSSSRSFWKCLTEVCHVKRF